MVLCLNGWTTKPLPWPLCQLCQIYFQLDFPHSIRAASFVIVLSDPSAAMARQLLRRAVSLVPFQ